MSIEVAEKIVLYTPKDIQRIFKCGRRKAYDLMNSPGFPSFRIDTLLYVEHHELEKWIARNRSKNVNT